MSFTTFDENDPQVELLLNKGTHPIEDDNCQKNDVQSSGISCFVLVSDFNEEIIIPKEGGIIGRTEIGAEVLAKYPSVSKQHIKIYPSFGNRIVVEDISRFGTLLNGIKIEKNVPHRIAVDAKLTLCNVDFTLYEKFLQE